MRFQFSDGLLQMVIADDGSATDAVTGAAVTLADDAEDSMVNNRLRGALDAALSLRDLFGSDVPAQQAAAAMLQKAAFDEPDAAQLPLVVKVLANPSLDPQARGVRVNQAREFTRLGGVETVKVDARIIAATNLDLRQMMEDGRFRVPRILGEGQ